MRGREQQRGSILFVVAGALVALVGAAAWVVDLASAYLSRTHQQAAADAGAIAATYSLVPTVNSTAAQQAATVWVGRNGYTIGGAATSIWDYSSTAKAVSVGWTQSVPTSFGRIFGVQSMPVAVKASASLGGPTVIPTGFLPFAVPAYKDTTGAWYVLGSTTQTDYRLLTMNPPTQMIFKLSPQSQNIGNFLALALDGTGASIYSNEITYGASRQLNYGTVVATQTGNMHGPTFQGLQGRQAVKGANWANVMVPMISRQEWESSNGHSQVTLIGFLAAQITGYTGNGDIYAQFTNFVVPAPVKIGMNQSPGAFAPILVPNP